MNTEGFVEPQASAAKQNLYSTPRISAGNPVLNEIEIKKVVSKFMENKQAFEYFEKHTIEKLKKNASKSTCPHILLDNNTLLCIKAHKNKYNISTENITIYFRNGNFVCAEDGTKTIKYIDDNDIDIPKDFYIVGQGAKHPTTNSIGGLRSERPFGRSTLNSEAVLRPPVGTEGSNLEGFTGTKGAVKPRSSLDVTVKSTDDEHRRCSEEEFGQTLDNEEQTYKVLPIFENRYMISKYIADKFILMYQDKSIFTITYEDKPLYSQGPTTQDYPYLCHYI